MAVSNRADRLTKTFKVLSKHYKATKPPADRSLLEHFLYACCLENSVPQAADDALARLQDSFFDWNEVRVSTIAELSEVMSCLSDPTSAAKRLKQTLQAIFESHYTYDLEFLKKGNLGKSIKEIEKFRVTAFVLAYVTQHGLAGHSIPVSQALLDTFLVLGIVSEAEADKGSIPGMERAIAKSKGIEFASLIHQLAVDYATSPFSPRVRNILSEIDPDVRDRLPKRSSKGAASDEAPAKAEPKKAEPEKKPAAKKPEAKKAAAKKVEPKAPEKKPAKKTPAKEAAQKSPPKKVSKKAAKKAAEPKSAKKASTKGLSRKKPK